MGFSPDAPFVSDVVDTCGTNETDAVCVVLRWSAHASQLKNRSVAWQLQRVLAQLQPVLKQCTCGFKFGVSRWHVFHPVITPPEAKRERRIGALDPRN